MFGWLRRMRDPVEGTAQVVAASAAHSGTSGTGRFHLVVEAPGVPPTAVEHKQMSPTDRWPYPGMVIPVLVDRADPQRVKIRFDDMTTHRDQARQQAEAIARARRVG